METGTEFKYKDMNIKIEHVHTNCWRVIEMSWRTWNLVTADNLKDATRIAKRLLKLVFPNGEINFNVYPPNAKYIVTGVRWDDKQNKVVPCERLHFRTGTHSKNITGTGDDYAYKDEVIILNSQGEDNGFYYLDKGREIHPKYYFQYVDGSDRYAAKGRKHWSLIWSLQIKPI